MNLPKIISCTKPTNWDTGCPKPVVSSTQGRPERGGASKEQIATVALLPVIPEPLAKRSVKLTVLKQLEKPKSFCYY